MLYTDLGGNLGANKVKKNQAADQNRLWVYSEDWATSLSLFTFMHWRRKWQPTPVFLPGESQGWGTLVDSAAAATHFSRVRLCATLWAVAHQAPPVPGLLQARTLEWGAVPSPRGSSRPRDWTRISYVSCISWQVPQLNRWIFLNLKVVLWENTLLFDVQTESHPLKASLRYACSDVFLRAWKPKKVFNFLMKKHKPLYQSHS